MQKQEKSFFFPFLFFFFFWLPMPSIPMAAQLRADSGCCQRDSFFFLILPRILRWLAWLGIWVTLRQENIGKEFFCSVLSKPSCELIETFIIARHSLVTHPLLPIGPVSECTSRDECLMQITDLTLCGWKKHFRILS